jgi:transposase
MKRYPTNTLQLYDDASRVDRLEVLEGPTGRRSWPDDVKARIVLESDEPDAKVCDIARRHGMAPQHLSAWRGLAKKGRLALPMPDDGEVFFAPLEITPESEVAETAADASIEIDAGGVTVRLPGNTEAVRVAEVAMALRVR